MISSIFYISTIHNKCPVYRLVNPLKNHWTMDDNINLIFYYRQISQLETSPYLNVTCEINMEDVQPTLFIHMLYIDIL